MDFIVSASEFAPSALRTIDEQNVKINLLESTLEQWENACKEVPDMLNLYADRIKKDLLEVNLYTEYGPDMRIRDTATAIRKLSGAPEKEYIDYEIHSMIYGLNATIKLIRDESEGE
jgi:hypothetical protein